MNVGFPAAGTVGRPAIRDRRATSLQHRQNVARVADIDTHGQNDDEYIPRPGLQLNERVAFPMGGRSSITMMKYK